MKAHTIAEKAATDVTDTTIITNTPRAGESAEQTAARTEESRREYRENRIAKHHTIAPHDMRRVILESPFSGDVEVNLTYARACMRDSLLRGEAPQVSHCLYTQPGVLDDNDPLERVHGINAGHAWLTAADAMVVYTDRGISSGMQAGINTATFNRIPIEYRSLTGVVP